MRKTTCALVAVSAVLAVVPRADAAGAQYGAIMVIDRVPIGGGCDRHTELLLDAANDADGRRVAVSQTQMLICGDQYFSEMSLVGSIGAATPAEVSFSKGGKIVAVRASVPVERWTPSGSTSDTVVIDVTITDSVVANRPSRPWSASATGSVRGPLPVSMAGRTWTGYPTTREWPVSAASTQQLNPKGRIRGGVAVVDPAFPRQNTASVSSGWCGTRPDGSPAYSQTTRWSRSPQQGGLQAVHFVSDPACGWTAALFMDPDPLNPDGSVNQSKVFVVTVAPGSDVVIGPSDINRLGLAWRSDSFGEVGSFAPCADPSWVTDLLVSGKAFTTTRC